MDHPIVAASRTTTARDIAIYMLLGAVSGIPITEMDGTVVGIVTELDLIRALRAGKNLETTPASEIMTPDVITVDTQTPLASVMEILETEHILRIPVLKGGRMVGVLSRTSVLKAAVEPKFMDFG